MPDAQASINARLWRSGRLLWSYKYTTLKPAEAIILARYREALGGRVLDVGCGAGRILGYLVEFGDDVHGIDISPRVVAYCSERYDADVRVGDLGDLKAVVHGPFDAILLTDNVLDVFDDAHRRRVLADARTLLAPDGLLIFSSHNLASWDTRRPRSRLREWTAGVVRRSIGSLGLSALNAPRRWRNRRRLGRLQYRDGDHAIINDGAHEYALLHYFIGHVAQERQLRELGYRLIEALEFSGQTVEAGKEGHDGSLYYVATPVAR